MKGVSGVRVVVSWSRGRESRLACYKAMAKDHHVSHLPEKGEAGGRSVKMV